MAKLTPEEQIYIVNGQSFFAMGEIPEKGISRVQMLDGGTGLNFEQLFGDFLTYHKKEGNGGAAYRDVLEHYYEPEKLGSDEAREMYEWICARVSERIPDRTAPGCYPPGMLLGATWDAETVEAVGHALGHEARAYGVHVLLGTPNVNIHRDPRGGRAFEGYSEDPYLVTQLAPALVRGVEAEGVAANAKHFAANNQETYRLGINEHIPERALYEIYYPGFKACAEAGCATVMAAYNQINGVPCTENTALLTDLLRKDWGFKGLVMSDWGAVYHPAEALNAGTDVNMPGPVAPDALRAALADGSLDPEKLAESAERAVALSEKYALPPTGHIDLEMTDRAAYNAAAEGIVMLKNEHGCCPLPENAKIALHGTFCENLLTCGEGSAGIHTNRNVSFLSALRSRFLGAQKGGFDGADTLICVYSVPGREGNDRRTIALSNADKKLLHSLTTNAQNRNMRKILILNVSAPVDLCGYDSAFDAIFCCFLPGMQGANALADILAGRVNPSGHLPLTFPLSEREMPTALNFPGDGMDVTYGEGIFVGYRWYTTLKRPCLYPFGFGLSYTDFELTGITADRETFTDAVQVTVTVKNTGSRGGKTVVQLYVQDPVSFLTKPVRELKAFRKVYLEAGEEKALTFTLGRHAFESYDPNLHAWTFEEGGYRIFAGFSAMHVPVSVPVCADTESPYTYGAGTPVKTVYENEQLCKILHDFMDAHGMPWTLILSTYEYTAQDPLQKIFDMLGTPEPLRNELYAALRAVRRA
ncbi:MAG: glycoside hydrolase family 3 C-terminal domain-containing protein [Oscillospiraceae bacterium]|nr:glycoside hydrolase family 3 C-terminal domain-containing protein [Oscillospiraceae bacterium]